MMIVKLEPSEAAVELNASDRAIKQRLGVPAEEAKSNSAIAVNHAGDRPGRVPFVAHNLLFLLGLHRWPGSGWEGCK
jgi:hypothetical protein